MLFSPASLTHHADSPVLGTKTGQAQLLLDTGTSHSLGSPLCPCQEFLQADGKRCWPKWHGKPRSVWEHINLLPGETRGPCQVRVELQTCTIFCRGPNTVKRAGQSWIQRGSCHGAEVQMPWWRWLQWQMEEEEAHFPDFQSFYLFSILYFHFWTLSTYFPTPVNPELGKKYLLLALLQKQSRMSQVVVGTCFTLNWKVPSKPVCKHFSLHL